jgi:hypothetical protein
MTSNLISLSVLFAGLGGLLAGCSSAHYAVRQAKAAEGPGARAVVVVRVPSPWFAPRFVIRGKFRDALPEYEAIGALEAKYFTISDDGQFGGLYVWASRADAERHFDAVWRANVRKRRGVDADVLVMNAPYVVGGPALPEGEPIGARSVQFPAWVSLVRWELAPEARVASAAEVLSHAAWAGPALVRGFVVTGPRFVGVAALWATREAAEAAAASGARTSLGASLEATGSSALLFEAPLLVDATLRTERERSPSSPLR